MVENWEEWVLRRARCNADDIFAELQEQVEQDVAYMKSVTDAKNDRVSFQFSKEDERRFVVERNAAPPAHQEGVVFQNSFDKIIVDHWRGSNTPSKFYVVWKWNEQQCKCELFIDDGDEPHEVWQVSQKALLPLFFPSVK